MADQTITALDPVTSDVVRYEIGRENWAPAAEDEHGWIPDVLHSGTGTVRLTENEIIDVVILGDGYECEGEFRDRLENWIQDFFQVEVYERFRGAFRIRALFTRSNEPCTIDRDSYYGVKIDEDGDVARDDWWNADDAAGEAFREKLFTSVHTFGVNTARYPGSLDVGGSSTVIHNALANVYSNLVVIMLVRRSMPDGSGIVANATGMTRLVARDQSEPAYVNVGFGSHSLHEFGHAFAYLEDEYISERGSNANRDNPSTPSIFTLSNLSFSDKLGDSPWHHLSPWGSMPRQAAGAEPSPVVGWLWRGGEQDHFVWHSEYQCLMNGKHENYAYTTDADNDPTAHPTETCNRFVDGGVDLRWRNPPRYCLWCQEIVVLRILEKTGQLLLAGDPESINERGQVWHARWIADGRRRYWDFFDLGTQIGDRETLYASPGTEPGSFCQILNDDGTYLPLWRSNLYRVFRGEDIDGGSPPAANDGDELLMVVA
jgi:IgA Peptidase M64